MCVSPADENLAEDPLRVSERRGRNQAELVERGEAVGYTPMLDHASIGGESTDIDDGDSHGSTGLAVRPPCRHARPDLVPVGDDVLDCQMKSVEACTRVAYLKLENLGSGQLGGETVLMLGEVGGADLVSHIKIASIETAFNDLPEESNVGCNANPPQYPRTVVEITPHVVIAVS
jgi:hypothetical protein